MDYSEVFTPSNIVLLYALGFITAAIASGVAIGYMLPVTARVESFLGKNIAVASCVVMLLAVASTFSTFVHPGMIPLWISATLGGFYLVSVGSVRGFSLRKNGRWI